MRWPLTRCIKNPLASDSTFPWSRVLQLSDHHLLAELCFVSGVNALRGPRHGLKQALGSLKHRPDLLLNQRRPPGKNESCRLPPS